MPSRTRRSRTAVLAISVLMLTGFLAPAPPAAASAASSPIYETSGTPVTGSATGCEDAPYVAPGQFVDSLIGGQDLYYRVKKRPDQLLQVSATVVLAHDVARNAAIEVFAGPMPWDTEPDGWLHAFGTVVGWSNVLSAGARSEAPDPDKTTTPPPGGDGCIRLDNRVHETGDRPLPVELLIGLADADPAKSTPPPAPQVRTGADAVGGRSFADATPIAPGRYQQDLVVGEYPMWRVEVGAGQRLSVKGGVEIPGDFGHDTTSAFTVITFNPMRTEASCAPHHSGRVEFFGRESGRFEMHCGPWQVADLDKLARNLETDYDIPGTYYIVVAVAEHGDRQAGRVVPVDMTVGVEGEARDEPAPVFDFGGGAASGAPSDVGSSTGQLPDTAKSAGGGSTASRLALPVGIALGLALLGSAAYYGLRRR